MEHCCEDMQREVGRTCDQHADRFACPDCLISYSLPFREYGLMVHDGTTSSIIIRYCPWCGSRLPDSLRDRWFDELEAQGFDDPWRQNIPSRYHTDAWYREGDT